MITREGIRTGMTVKFPELDESHIEWAANTLWNAFNENRAETDKLFQGVVEQGLREGNEHAIQYAMASMRALVI